MKLVRDESHIAGMVLDEFKEALDIFGIKDLVFDKISVVADCGSNIVAKDGISSEFDLLGCIDHKISNCLTYVLNKTTKQVDGKKSKPFYRYQDEPNMAALYALIDACKSLVAYFKKSNLQSKLSKTLKQGCIWRFQLLRHLEFVMNDVINDDGTVNTSKDTPSIIVCKCMLTPLVQEKMELDVLHVVATLLDPVVKNHMCKMEVPDALVTKAKAKLREFMGLIGTGGVVVDLSRER